LRSVAKKTRFQVEINRTTRSVLRECRSIRRSARISWQPGLLWQKPFAIGGVHGEKSANGGGMTIVTRVFAAGGKG
jgi:Leu/Phe-tRNA-protein transferase